MVETKILTYEVWRIVYQSQMRGALSTPICVLNAIMRKYAVTRDIAKAAIKGLIDARWLTYAELGASCLAINAPDVWPWSEPKYWS